MADAPRDANRVTTLIGASSADGKTPVIIEANPTDGTLFTALEGSAKYGSGNALGIASASYSLQDHFEAITDWVESVGADGIAVDVDHRGPGTKSIEFDKIAGDTTAMISKTITTLDMSAYSTHSIGHMHTYISDLTNVDYVFVRMGTDSSNYWQWNFDAGIMTDGWNDLNTAINQPTSQIGNGMDISDATWIAFGVVFDAAANTLADIRTSGWAIKRVLETAQIVNADVQVSTPWVGIKDQNSNTRMDVANGASYNYLYNRNTDGTNLMPTGDADARALSVNLGANNDVTVTGTVTANAGTNLNTSALATSANQLADGHNVTVDNGAAAGVYIRPGTGVSFGGTPNEYELAGNTSHVKKYYTYVGSVSNGIIWSPAAGKRWYVTDIFINVSAVATVILEDDLTAGDAVIWKAELYANAGWSHSFTTPWFSGEDAADLTVTTDTGNIYIMVTGYEV